MLKLCVCRDDEGELSGSFTIEGDFGALCGVEGGIGADDGLRLVGDLLREFQRGNGRGGALA